MTPLLWNHAFLADLSMPEPHMHRHAQVQVPTAAIVLAQEKREWMKGRGQGYVYVSGRSRPKGETNGKSGNLNNVFGQIYPRELDIPGNEVLCIFDADQVSTAVVPASSSKTGFLSPSLAEAEKFMA